MDVDAGLVVSQYGEVLNAGRTAGRTHTGVGFGADWAAALDETDDEDAVYTLMYSSGTSGAPKGVSISKATWREARATVQLCCNCATVQLCTVRSMVLCELCSCVLCAACSVLCSCVLCVLCYVLCVQLCAVQLRAACCVLCSCMLRDVCYVLHAVCCVAVW